MFSSEELSVQGGELFELIDKEEIVKILECPCCKEAAVPPIHTCESGHIICTLCRPKLDVCAICREEYTNARNFPLEAIFNGSTFVCKYRGNGCQEVVLGEAYSNHLRNCEYRSITCGHCLEELTPIANYIDHIKLKHGAFGYETEEDSYVFKNWTHDIFNDCLYFDDYVFYDGKYFVSSLQVKDRVVYQWISVIGNDVDAVKYNAKITVLKKNSEVPRVEWTIPVVPIQNGQPNFQLCTAIPVDPTLRSFLSKNVKLDDHKIWEYVWYHKYSIIKI